MAEEKHYTITEELKTALLQYIMNSRSTYVVNLITALQQVPETTEDTVKSSDDTEATP